MTLTLTDVTLTYPDGDRRLTALDRVDLTVGAGELTAVVGPSGSGKSSLLAVAGTLVTPDSGSVLVAGKETTILSQGDRTSLRRTEIGIVFQQSNLLPSLTALEQLEVRARVAGASGRAARAAARDLLDAVGLVEQADRRPHQLSGGQRQRVNIARALVNQPAVLLVDEPTSALDRERGRSVLDLIARLTREHGTATVLVTHDHDHLDIADAVVEVVDGRTRTPAPMAG